MKIVTIVASFFLIVAALFSLGARPGSVSEDPWTERDLTDPSSQGNHDLNCTVIQPWSESSEPGDFLYPIIVWANGWGYNDVLGEEITAGYKPGLIEWALDGPYIVVAANQWSVQESDVLNCLQAVIDEYNGTVDPDRIGLAGHSQGGGAVIKAGDGGGDSITITATIPMNPYGPAWVNPENQDGPMMLIGGCEDTTTPPDSYQAVWEAVQENDQGGINAALVDGTHNDDPWAPEDDSENPQDYNFGRYQIVTELWWDFQLNDNKRSGQTLMKLLNKYPWNQDCFPTETAFTDDFEL